MGWYRAAGRRTTYRLGLLLVAALLAAVTARGAVEGQSHAGQDQTGQNQAAPDKGSAASKQQAAPSQPSTSPAPKPSTPAAAAHDDSQPNPSSKSGPQSHPSSQANAFPLKQSEAAAHAAQEQSQEQKAGPYSSSHVGLSPNALGQGASPIVQKPSRGMDTLERDHTLDGRISDDLNAADLYMKTGNYRGALWRYQDALHYDPENDVALYGVAAAMCKQNRTHDAMAHFKSYVERHPQGKYADKAAKMLAHPDRCRHNR